MSAGERTSHSRLPQIAAREISRFHRIASRRAPPLDSLDGLDEMSRWLEQARGRFAKPQAATAKAAEWLLDNAYLVQRAVRQIHEDLPQAFYEQLPVLEVPLGTPRVYAIARTLLGACELQISAIGVIRFVNAYQEREQLDLSELWALPVMLRLACLEELTAALARLDPQLRNPLPRLPLTGLGEDWLPEETECVARATRALKSISDISWSEFVAQTSVVERTLAGDPDGIYTRMDFETRDTYRKAVERLARGTAYTEEEVAGRAVQHAQRSGDAAPDEESHVGYWLVDEGLPTFEASLGYRAGLRERAVRQLDRHGEPVYLSALLVTTLTVMIPPAAYLHALDAPLGGWLAALVLALLPAFMLAVTVVQWAIVVILPPRVLPKLDFSKGITADFETAVVIPTLLGSRRGIDHLLHQIECHYLCNPDPRLRFVALSDFLDAPTEHCADDDALLDRATDGIRELNDRHAVEGRDGPFHLLHRSRRYNPGQDCWMGWERKRGKLEQFNQLVISGESRAFELAVGPTDRLRNVRFVITLDTDTQLPRATAARLVGTLAHPLNQARFDPSSGAIRRGYSIVQPRVSITPGSGNRSLFTRLFAGDTAIDIYSRAVSDAYQDLLGTGIYVGKGIYDVDAFRRCLEDRVPENAVVSHDLFEGLFARVALASDILLYEEYPPNYLAYARRTHRWIRGDWQLQPWLGRRVPNASGERVATPFSLVDRWKLLDNLRRSLLAPAQLSMLVTGWLWLPGSPMFWTLLALLAPAGHLLTDFVSHLSREPRRGPLRDAALRTARGLREDAGRWALLLAFLPFEATTSLDAAARTLIRMRITRRNLLSWTAAAHAASELREHSARWSYWREMATAPLLALLFLLAIIGWQPVALPMAAPLLLLWLVAPELAYRISRPAAARRERLELHQLAFLRRLARRTWLFFETFVGPDDHWLPPDNFQEQPREVIAHRTSPTNIGMLLLSSLAAYDLGYLGLDRLSSQLRSCFEALARLERYRGHLLNWYDTRTLEPLQPRYVSTVDSGNLAGALIALSSACSALRNAPILAPARWDGLVDTLALLDETARSMDVGEAKPVSAGLRKAIWVLIAEATAARDRPDRWQRSLDKTRLHALDQRLVEALDARGALLDVALLRELRIWIDRAHEHISAMQLDMDRLQPWRPLLAGPRGSSPVAIEGPIAEAAAQLSQLLPADLALGALADRTARARALLESLSQSPETADLPREERQATELWIDQLALALTTGEENAQRLAGELAEIEVVAESMAFEMDFRLLYDFDDHLFFIGYNLNANRLDPHHYDLLASEARLASFIAIAGGQVPIEHWFALARPMTRVAGSDVLLSWGGTLFEYLMPTLLLASHERTLLAQSARAAVAAQIAYGEDREVPWGISESGFAALSADQDYQYRAFGVPGMGLRRGLADDLVITPYASGLALGWRPRAAAENLERLGALSMMGRYGLFEAIDFTPDRLPRGSRYAIVRSYMAHHQGMLLAALDNLLCDSALSNRFHADRQVQSAELLLHERVPAELAAEALPETEVAIPATESFAEAPALPSWRPVQRGAYPEVQLLGNGRLSSLVTDSGSGGLMWQGIALTRWAPDRVSDDSGLWIYVRDDDDGSVWSLGRQPTGMPGEGSEVLFHSHAVEFHRHDHGIGLRAEIAVAPADDVEIRLITVRNDTPHRRRLSFTSYAEVVLAAPAEYERHPAFSKLFVESEYRTELDALVFRRRPRSLDEHTPHFLHRLVYDSQDVSCQGVETDRARFIGRGGSMRRPPGSSAPLSGQDGKTLDPILSVRAGVELEPHATVRIAFVTLVAGSRESLLEDAERFDSLASLDWVLEDASREARREAHHLALPAPRLPSYQRLLSLLVFPYPALRCPPGEISRNRSSQSRLWGLSISGELPVLLLRVPTARDSALLGELIGAHQLWRRRGFPVDLVVLSSAASSYDEGDRDELRRALREVDAEEWLGREGGIHLLRSDQIGSDEHRLLEVTARVILDWNDTLEVALEDSHEAALYPPTFVSTDPGQPDDPPLPVERPNDLLFDNSYGGFSRDGSEYCIHLEPGTTTPAPWCNVLANDEFGCVVSESGSSFSWASNCAENRLTPWSNDPVVDPPGEALYLRDEASGDIWSPTPKPVPARAPYQVHHGAGYSEWRHHSHGLTQRLRIFVPQDAPVKLVELRLHNSSGRVRRITATYYAEWVLGNTRRVTLPFVVTEYDPGSRALMAHCAWNAEFAERTAFLASSHPPHGFTTDRAEFLGREGDLSHPAALDRFGLSDRSTPGGDPCAALQIHLDIAPDAEVDVLFALGQGSDREQAQALARRWTDRDNSKTAWLGLNDYWESQLGAVRVETPEPAFDVMINRWLLYQVLSSRLLARTGFHQSSGAIGFRDQLQDVLALVQSDPQRVRNQLLVCAAAQFEEGDVLHWWHPPHHNGVRTRCSDDLLWLPFATAHYVRTTGDASVLDEEIPFLQAPPLGDRERDRFARFPSGKQGHSLLEHCERALERGITSGPHGLPLIAGGDWNDGMNRMGERGRGESIWLGWFAVTVMKDFARLCETRGDDGLARSWHRRADTLSRTVERAGWGGEWYLRAFDDEGRPWGSRESEECQIDSISQSWAVLSGAAAPERAEAALRSVATRLVREEEKLVTLLWPPFDATPRNPGYIKAYPPGIRENGGQYNHATAWLAWAFASLGDGDQAVRIFGLLNPIGHSAERADAERYRVEPYVVAADIAGAPPHTGRGGWTWYTGSAAWAWRAGVEGILGLERVDGMLAIDPRIPRHWGRCRARLRFEGGALDVCIEDPDGVGSGVAGLSIDGDAVEGSAVPLPADGEEHRVVVRLGKG